MMDTFRRDTVAMYRIRNEARWMARSLERTFQVAETVVIWDDGSEDHTEAVCEGWHGELNIPSSPSAWGWFQRVVGPRGPCDLHYLRSPFRPARRTLGANELRDRNVLWEYVKTQTDAKIVLCLDGDEMLSRAALARWPVMLPMLAWIDIVHLPFVYLWDTEDQRRVDGIYGPREGLATLNFPRVFTLARVSPEDLQSMRFSWEGVRGGFHCGSIPREHFRRMDGKPLAAQALELPVIHFGYLDAAERRRKFDFYRQIDPNSVAEGGYLHIIGESNIHAPGPIEVVPWADEDPA